MNYDSDLSSQLTTIAWHAKYSVLPGAGWMATTYWGSDELPFDTSFVTTVPVMALQVSLERDEDAPYADPRGYIEALYPTDPGTTDVGYNPDPGNTRLIWHPDSVATEGIASTHAGACEILEAEHRWWPVEKMTIKTAEVLQDGPHRVLKLTVEDEHETRAATGRFRSDQLFPARLMAFGIERDELADNASLDVSQQELSEKILRLVPEFFQDRKTWGQFMENEVARIGLYPPGSTFSNSVFKNR